MRNCFVRVLYVLCVLCTCFVCIVCDRIENFMRTIVQHSRGCLDKSQGYFYASEDNLSQLCKDSLNVLEVTNTSEPIEFVEVR